MNIRIYTLLVLLIPSASPSHAQTNSWFPGALNLKIAPALPTNYMIVSANPAAKGTKEMDILDGVIWSTARTAQQFDFGGNGKLNEATEPLFHVAVTPLVMQKAGTEQFTNEKDLEAKSKTAGLKN